MNRWCAFSCWRMKKSSPNARIRSRILREKSFSHKKVEFQSPAESKQIERIFCIFLLLLLIENIEIQFDVHLTFNFIFRSTRIRPITNDNIIHNVLKMSFKNICKRESNTIYSHYEILLQFFVFTVEESVC